VSAVDGITFRLNEEFVAKYKTKKPPFGYRDAGGTSLGEITYLRTYSRKKEDGTKERWYETCRRVIEGMFSLQKDHVRNGVLPWNDNKAQHSAQDAYDRLFNLKWSPPGRGLWVMGTPIVNVQRNSAALQNCAFVSTSDMTKSDPAGPFAFLMEASMLGVGVGFDTEGASKGLKIFEPTKPMEFYTVPDTREGWVESTKLILESYLMPNRAPIRFDYSEIREEGEPIKTFGGTAAGPQPLMRLHGAVRKLLGGRHLQLITTVDIADIGNMIGVCVVSGNVRRSAELLIGKIDDKDFLNLKNADQFAERNFYDPTGENSGWSWMSNNSVAVNVGDDLTPIIEGIARNGEPGVIWLDVSQQYGRLGDARNDKDWRVQGYNPCAEQSLESYEMCTLVETYLNRHDSLEDFQKTLKYAYLYAKTVTLLPTHWPRTNSIMQRNRRIGTSVSGIANFLDNRGGQELRKWFQAGYDTVQKYDKTYSEWLCVRESIKTTTVKPSGTVSILAGESPGVHWSPGGEYFERAIRFAKSDPLALVLAQAGYRVEAASESPDTTVVVFFPIHSLAKRSEQQVTIFEKAALAVEAQRWWSDNSVSVTLSFDKDAEKDHVGKILHMYEGQLKTASFLPMGKDVFPQMPYAEIESAAYGAAELVLFPADLDPIYDGEGWDAIGERFCSTDGCELKDLKINQI
jgi:ribonucleoside-triphosphate reductase